jgi:hypothetical protein
MSDELLGVNFRVIMEQGGSINACIPALAKDDILELKIHGYDERRHLGRESTSNRYRA